MSHSPTDTHCALAWKHLATNSSGQIRLCCNSIPGLNLIREGEASFSLAKPGSIEAAWNASSQRQIRQQMLTGERPAACARCFKEEDSGIRSPRHAWNEFYSTNVTTLKEITSEDGGTPVEVRYLDLRLGNLCNLKCRMCNPYASQKWLEDWDLIESPMDEKQRARLAKLDWFEGEEFFENLKPHLETIDKIYFTGGEPMLSKAHVRILEYLVENNRAPELTLKYNTNLTVLPASVIRHWSNFKKVKLNCSMDGVGTLNEYIRHPTRWSDVERNMDLIDDMADRMPGLDANVHVTVQAYNILNLSEILDFVLQRRNFRTIPYLNILNHPHWLNIRALPLELKQLASQRIDQWLIEHPRESFHQQDSAWERVRDLSRYMFGQDTFAQSFAEFANKTQILNQSRGENLEALAPELAQAIHSQLGAAL